MSGLALTLEQADESSLPYIEARLEANGLPSEDVRGKAESFYIGHSGENRVGIGGVENYGTAGLLRSVVVEEAARGNGFGTAICEALETQARSDGVETLYLLTTTASGFFADRGYATTERADAPPRIQETAEFAELCPSTATCMKKRL